MTNLNRAPQINVDDQEAIDRMVGEGSPIYAGQLATQQTASMESTQTTPTKSIVVDTLDMDLARSADEGNPNLL